MADTKISDLNALTGDATAGNDVLVIIDTSAVETKKITLTELQSAPVSAGTANGVLYLNGSKVATSGSGLVFNGTNLGLGVTPSAWNASVRAIETATGAFYSYVSGSVSNFYVLSNAYLNSTGALTYKQTAASAQYLQSAGNHYWYTAPTGNAGDPITFTQAMTLDASGTWLLGKTSAGSAGGIEATPNVAGLGFGRLYLNSSYNSPANSVLFAYNGASVGIIQQGTTATSYYTSGTLTGIQGIDASTLGFATTGAERARIDSSGNLLVGHTGAFTEDVDAIRLEKVGGVIVSKHVTGTASGSYHTAFMYGAFVIGSITQNGTTAVAYNTSSDYRLKNITGPVQNSGSYIDSLKPVEGTWKADGSTFVGLIAHEVQEVSRTNVATGEKDGAEMQAMDYSNSELIANLIAEVQALRKRVAQLEAR